MSKTGLLRSVTSATLAAAVFATSSLAAFAAPGKTAMGELTVAGDAQVLVNGESANTGRTVFSSNTITTPATAGATVNLGKLGQIELAPNSTLKLNFDEHGISGDLQTGRVKVAGAPNVAASINTRTGVVTTDQTEAKTFVVNFDGAKTEAASEVGSAVLNENGKAVKVGNKQNDDDEGFFGGQSVVYGILFGVAAGVVIYIAARDNNEVNAGSGVVVSPTR